MTTHDNDKKRNPTIHSQSVLGDGPASGPSKERTNLPSSSPKKQPAARNPAFPSNRQNAGKQPIAERQVPVQNRTLSQNPKRSEKQASSKGQFPAGKPQSMPSQPRSGSLPNSASSHSSSIPKTGKRGSGQGNPLHTASSSSGLHSGTQPQLEKTVSRAHSSAQKNVKPSAEHSSTAQASARTGDFEDGKSVLTGRPLSRGKTKESVWQKIIRFLYFDISSEHDNRIRVRSGVDGILLSTIFVLLCIGSIMIASASYASGISDHNDGLYYIKQHLLYLLGGCLVMFFVSFLDYKWIEVGTVPLYGISLFLLLLVLVMGVAKDQAVRWLDLKIIRFQPSELMKLSLVLMLAYYYKRFHKKVFYDTAESRNLKALPIPRGEKWRTLFKKYLTNCLYSVIIPAAFVLLACGMIMLENHFSGTIIVGAIGLSVMFVGGARILFLAFGGGACVAFLGLKMMSSEYAMLRIDTWLHPENYSSQNETYQFLQGKYAIGSGGLTGVGLFNSSQKYSFVSEPQNDFIFTIFCEECGFIGAVAVLLIFGVFVWRGLCIAMKAPDRFSSLTAFGITMHVALQVLLNIGVVTGVIPNTGVTLPFFSYGGSALLMLLTEMGVLLCISRYSYQKK